MKTWLLGKGLFGLVNWGWILIAITGICLTVFGIVNSIKKEAVEDFVNEANVEALETQVEANEEASVERVIEHEIIERDMEELREITETLEDGGTPLDDRDYIRACTIQLQQRAANNRPKPSCSLSERYRGATNQ